MASIPEWVASVNKARSLGNDSDSDESIDSFERIEVEVEVHYSEHSDEPDFNQTSRDKASAEPDDDSQSVHTAIEPEWDIEVKTRIWSWFEFLRRTSDNDEARCERNQLEPCVAQRKDDPIQKEDAAPRVLPSDDEVKEKIWSWFNFLKRTLKKDKAENTECSECKEVEIKEPDENEAQNGQKSHVVVFEDDDEEIFFYMETKRSSPRQWKRDAILETMKKIMAQIDTFTMRTVADDGVGVLLEGCNCENHEIYSGDSGDRDIGIQRNSERVINIKYDSDSSESSAESESDSEDSEDSNDAYNSDSERSMKPDSIDSAIFKDDEESSEQGELKDYNASNALLVSFILAGMMGCYGAYKIMGEQKENDAHNTKGLMTQVQRLERENKIILERIKELEESQAKIGKAQTEEENTKETTETFGRSESSVNDIQFHET
ncbi:unnamed protein product [Bursaphelenchus xylophilus]|uniref:(pine wood nematode) hypothetical protein n=1 Tax=Bursaphelenchus xylophilus TaxID=6326 RepID=A0A7I8X0Y1_BURXY|nr:unnamed protein product [Bursaphelenchus xylophilus]CAG9129673.1 unnamed protein product [Bursaphelenchus xylophilus]